jgi:hypothetical protein
MKMNFSKGFAVLVLMVAAIAMAAAVPVTIDTVKLDGDVIDSVQDFPGETNILSIDRGQEFEVRVEVTADANLQDAQIEATIRGYDSDKQITDITDVFDMKANRTYIKKLTLTLPGNVDKDTYRLRIRVDSRDGDTTQEDFELEVTAERHAMEIKDVIFSPQEVMAGRSLLTTVRVKNVGAIDQNDGVKIMVNIPELGISAADYIDEVDEDDSVTSEELFLRIPSCVKAGVYDVEITAYFKDNERMVSADRTVKITTGEDCESATTPEVKPEAPKTVITYGSLSQELTTGQGGVIYPFTITNAGKEAKTYVLSVDGYSEWADVRISPANIMVIQPGETKAAYVYVSAKDSASAGEKMFTVTISSDNEVMKQLVAKAVVQQGKAPVTNQPTWDSMKRGLEVTLLVLVVILVIVGLIIGLTKLRGKDEGTEDEPKSYY